MKIAILSNTTIDVLVRYLPKEHSYYIPPGYDAWIEEILAADSGLNRFEPDAVFLLLDGSFLLRNCGTEESGIAESNAVLKYAEKLLQDFHNAAVFVTTFDIPIRSIRSINAVKLERRWELHWYNRLAALAEQYRLFTIFDFKELVEHLGRERFYSPKLWYMGGTPYSLAGTRTIAASIRQLIETHLGKRKKCLVLDLDNTLWGGILGEDGIEGVQLAEHGEGAAYRDFQLRLREIKETGVLLAVASKNNEHDIDEMFQNHPDMVLRKNDFAVIRANWNPKSQNLCEIAAELNIGIDSLVFIDDNPVEREEVRQMLPDVSVPEFPDPMNLAEFAHKLFKDYFPIIRLTDEDARKTLLYFQESQRKRAFSEAASFDDYIRSLEITIDIHAAKPEEINRIAQLTHKTNQFNLTTRRYTAGDIGEKIASPDWRIYAVHTKDRFGDNGLVSVVILHLYHRNETGESVAKIDTFLMSCRVMGRHIEDAILETIEEQLRNENIRRIDADYIPTSKNLPVAALYENIGYTVTRTFDDGRKSYQLDLAAAKPNRCIYAEITESDKQYCNKIISFHHAAGG